MRFAAVSICLFAASLVAASPAVAQSDTAPPTLVDFDFAPKSIDVTGGPASVQCTAHVTDAGSGVAWVQTRFNSPNSSAYAICNGSLTSGDGHDGVFTGTFSIPPYVEAGVWTVGSVTVVDNVQNLTSVSRQELQARGLPFSLSVASVSDIAPPALVDFDFAPKSIDVTGGPASVQCTAHVTDAGSGVAWVQTRFNSPNSSAYAICNGSLTSGDGHDGVFTGTFSIPPYVEAGVWTVGSVTVVDNVQNLTSVSRQELQARGLPFSLSVASVSDIAPPALVDFDFAPKSIDVTGGPASVQCTAHVTDAGSGVAWVQTRFNSPNSSAYAICNGSLTSGDGHDGVFTGTFSIPPYVEAGVWTVGSVTVVDNVQNLTSVSTADLAHFGYPSELRVCSDHLGRDTDTDGWGDDCDNCPSVYNPNQLDGDLDQVGNVCDDCPSDYDPSQTDFNHDGVGDRCDLTDGLILIYITDKDYVDWQNEAGPNAWNVYEGDLNILRSTGAYTQQVSSNPLADRRCHVNLNYTDALNIPPPGSVQFSLVTGMTGFIEGSLGTNSAGVPRANSNPCP